MTAFAHIINPVYAPRSEDLLRAQPITFATMRQARLNCGPETEVLLLTAAYAEDKPAVPVDFQATPLLMRSILDLGQFEVPRKLPLLADILGRAYEATAADYLIYTNVDISLQPTFYTRVQTFVDAGWDAFVINRRTISNHFQSLDQIPLMLQERGRPHRGWDCFVFRRDYFPLLELGHVCVGLPRTGLALLANLVAVSGRIIEFTDERLTFHIGDARGWADPRLVDYMAFNTAEVLRILDRLEARYGPFPRTSIPGSYLWRMRTFGPLYESWSRRAVLPAGLARSLNRLLRGGG